MQRVQGVGHPPPQAPEDLGSGVGRHLYKKGRATADKMGPQAQVRIIRETDGGKRVNEGERQRETERDRE